MESNNTVKGWISLIGFLLLLLGIYGSTRTLVNLKAFSHYPNAGAYYFNITGASPYPSPREEDCETITYTEPGKEISKEDQKKQKNSCLDSIRESRNQAEIGDISQSILFLFLGIGTLISRKWLVA